MFGVPPGMPRNCGNALCLCELSGNRDVYLTAQVTLYITSYFYLTVYFHLTVANYTPRHFHLRHANPL
jgi:hypothetical protein